MSHLTTIVSVIARNEQNKILMVQEAKIECRGKWYLPAGRVEPCEGIYDAAIRESQEEAGLTVKPLGIFSVEYTPHGSKSKPSVWCRFGIMAQVVGGTLKSVPDKESLCAAWFSEEEIQAMLENNELRAWDVLTVIAASKKNPLLPIMP